MKNLVKFLTVLCCICLAAACDKMNDLHQKYIDAGERVYLGKTDSVTAFPGVGRVKLIWFANADPKLETTVIYWNMRRDSIEKPFMRTQNGVQKDSVFIQLSEGTYIFELLYKNQLGKRSLPVSVQGVSYGETYAGKLRVRSVENISCTGFDPATESSTIKIIWGNVPEGCIDTKLTYKQRTTAEEVVLYVDESTTETILTDVGNRLEHPDDVLNISSIYAPEGLIDPIETLVQKEQLVLYMASGKRIENTLYEGSETTFTYTYAHQDKILQRVSSPEGNRVINCNRVAELSSATSSTTFRMTINDDQTVDVKGYYASPLNEMSNTESESSTFNSATGNLTMRYTVKTAGGSYTVEETLVPKNTPLEKEAAKPFGDMRSVIPGDNKVDLAAYYAFSNAFDGIHGPAHDNGWIGLPDATSTSITIDLKKKMKLTRMMVWGSFDTANPQNSAFSPYNSTRFELWGIAELDESKLSDAAYWVDAANPTGTFKEDWEFLGFHEVDRIDKKNATTQEIINRGMDGHHVILPESAGPVRYIRYYLRNDVANPAFCYLGELTFFGYAQ